MSAETSRAFLDRLEAHVLQPQFRYDHLHAPGDVTLWDKLHDLAQLTAIKSNINSLDDARLLYRLSCKGEPALSLPRRDARSGAPLTSPVAMPRPRRLSTSRKISTRLA